MKLFSSKLKILQLSLITVLLSYAVYTFKNLKNQLIAHQNPEFIYVTSKQAYEAELEKAKTQVEITACSYNFFKKLQKELDEVYKAVEEKYKAEPVVLTRLEIAQKAWMSFIDAELEASYPSHSEYWGTSFGTLINELAARLYRDRIAYLREYYLTGR